MIRLSWRRLLACLLLLAPATAAWGQEPGRARSLPGAVVKVVSGDTIHVFVNGDVERVRYIGVAAPDPGDGTTPESGEPLGRDALQFNRGLTNAKNVRLELDVQERDPEGRLLAYVWVGDVMANAEMIGHGLGQVVTGGPNIRHQEMLLRRQDQARATKAGIWRAASAAPPPARGAPAAAPAKSAAAARPGVPAKTGWSCPLSHPIKGNFTTYSAERCIYYVPGSPAYAEGRTERCYTTEDEARLDGCRRSR
ncbi:MAG TPA: thermonuclease family protein [Methylomirabilota bacterium]|nr:thermonuclease family protein [Methylomirabilota bacterium]